MKSQLFCQTIFLTSLMIGVSASAQLDTVNFLQQGFKEMQTQRNEAYQTQLNSHGDCPEGGTQVFDKLVEKKSGVLSAASAVQGVIKQTEPKVVELQSENNRCGSCNQENLISQFAVVHPEKVIQDPFCDNRPTRTFQKIFASTQAIQSYTQSILQGKGEEGQSLLAGCPDPCAYYISTAQTPAEKGQTHVTLTVQCGQPRKDNIFTAQYSFKAGVLQSWSCVK